MDRIENKDERTPLYIQSSAILALGLNGANKDWTAGASILAGKYNIYICQVISFL